MSPTEAALLVAAGLAAGFVNSLAGAGSILTVSLLVLLGLPGNLANGTNRVGVLVQNVVAAWRFRAEGVSGFRDAAPLLLPVILGSATGALAISRVADETFEKLFGLVMVALLIPILRRPLPNAHTQAAPRGRSRGMTAAVFFAIGVYGGAFQAGVGIALVFALAYAGFDLVRANSIKVVVNAALVGIAVPIFALQHQIHWTYAVILASGFLLGAEIGARTAVRGGERVIRPVLVVAVVALAGRMLGLY
jgi:uncharacterized membrane protein YfcA